MTTEELLETMPLRPFKAVSFFTDEDIYPRPVSWIDAKKIVERMRYESTLNDTMLVYVTPAPDYHRFKYGPWMAQCADMIISTYDPGDLKVLKCRFSDGCRDETLQLYKESIAA